GEPDRVYRAVCKSGHTVAFAVRRSRSTWLESRASCHRSKQRDSGFERPHRRHLLSAPWRRPYRRRGYCRRPYRSLLSILCQSLRFSFEAGVTWAKGKTLCVTSVRSVSLWLWLLELFYHRDTERTEVAQRNPRRHDLYR